MEDNKLSYFLFGLGMGVAIGVLFAPQSGKETRETLRVKANEGRDYLRRKGEEVRESAGELRTRVRKAVEAGQQAYREELAASRAESSGGAAG
jgi:gas vesicle protein